MAKRLALIVWLTVPLTLACALGRAHADSIVCRNGVASTGDHQSEILRKCGEPQFRKSFDTGYVGNGPVSIEEQWGYYIDKQRVFIFVNGFLRDIRY